MRVISFRNSGYEHVAAFRHPASGLTAYIAIHSTALGPAAGGVRMRPYPNEREALDDALRLSRAMTYKAAAAGLPLGGGKSVIAGDPARDKSPALWEAFGEFLESLGGRYIAAEDMGTTPEDMDAIARVSRHVLGTSAARGGTGNPASFTARGVLAGIRASLEWRFGDGGLSGCRVAVQGLGAVGMELAASLHDAGADLAVSDVREDRVAEAARRFGAEGMAPEEIHRAACEVFAPCAMGGVLDARTVKALRCQVVAGSANNLLASPVAAELLVRRGILYAPDYIINAGGLIGATAPLLKMDPDERDARIASIGERLLRVFARADREGIRPEQAADREAEDALFRKRRREPALRRRPVPAGALAVDRMSD
ncbi:MAG: Glu/Leu/Phe/Val dehydrogenase dimerization domain-containing protein [bacterium]